MPKIMYGTAWKKERTTDLVLQALKAGFRGIDTACQPKHYREDLVGKALQIAFDSGLVKREDLFIQTKFTSIDGQDTTQPIPYNPSDLISSQVNSSILTSLKNLGLSCIDSVILHSPLKTRKDTLSAWRKLEEFVNDGKIGMIGCSNIYSVKELQWLITEAKVKVGVVQNRWYEGNGWDWGVYDLCQKEGIRYQSFWTLTGSPTLLSYPLLKEMSSKEGLTPEQTLYKLCQLWNITPLCGSTTLQHVEEAIALANSSMTEEDPAVKELWKLMRGE